MKEFPMISTRYSFRHKTVTREGSIRFQTVMTASASLLIGLSAEMYWVDWGDGVVDTGQCHRYDSAGTYEVVISGMAINHLNLAHCFVKWIDLSGCPWLEYVDISFNFLIRLDVSACPYLIVLLCSRNLLRELKLGDSLQWLVYLDCSVNQLRMMEFPVACGLRYLLADSNQLKELDFLHCPDLCCVDIADNVILPAAMESVVDSLPVMEDDSEAYMLYELNPLYWQVDEEEMRRKGWGEVKSEATS